MFLFRVLLQVATASGVMKASRHGDPVSLGFADERALVSNQAQVGAVEPMSLTWARLSAQLKLVIDKRSCPAAGP